MKKKILLKSTFAFVIAMGLTQPTHAKDPDILAHVPSWNNLHGLFDDVLGRMDRETTKAVKRAGTATVLMRDTAKTADVNVPPKAPPAPIGIGGIQSKASIEFMKKRKAKQIAEEAARKVQAKKIADDLKKRIPQEAAAVGADLMAKAKQRALLKKAAEEAAAKARIPKAPAAPTILPFDPVSTVRKQIEEIKRKKLAETIVNKATAAEVGKQAAAKAREMKKAKLDRKVQKRMDALHNYYAEKDHLKETELKKHHDKVSKDAQRDAAIKARKRAEQVHADRVKALEAKKQERIRKAMERAAREEEERHAAKLRKLNDAKKHVADTAARAAAKNARDGHATAHAKAIEKRREKRAAKMKKTEAELRAAMKEKRTKKYR